MDASTSTSRRLGRLAKREAAGRSESGLAVESVLTRSNNDSNEETQTDAYTPNHDFPIRLVSEHAKQTARA